MLVVKNVDKIYLFVSTLLEFFHNLYAQALTLVRGTRLCSTTQPI